MSQSTGIFPVEKGYFCSCWPRGAGKSRQRTLSSSWWHCNIRTLRGAGHAPLSPQDQRRRLVSSAVPSVSRFPQSPAGLPPGDSHLAGKWPTDRAGWMISFMFSAYPPAALLSVGSRWMLSAQVYPSPSPRRVWSRWAAHPCFCHSSPDAHECTWSSCRCSKQQGNVLLGTIKLLISSPFQSAMPDAFHLGSEGPKICSVPSTPPLPSGDICHLMWPAPLLQWPHLLSCWSSVCKTRSSIWHQDPFIPSALCLHTLTKQKWAFTS